MNVTNLNCPCLKADNFFWNTGIFYFGKCIYTTIYSLLTLCEMSLTGADLKERAKMHSSEVSSFVSKARATINEMGM